MNKLKIEFTPEEKKKLREAKIKLSELENYSFNEILSAVDGDEKRTEEVRSWLFKWVNGSEKASLATGLSDQFRLYNPLKRMDALLGPIRQINRITNSVKNIESLYRTSVLGNNISRMLESPNMRRIADYDKLMHTTGLGLPNSQKNAEHLIGNIRVAETGVSKFMEQFRSIEMTANKRLHETLGTGLIAEFAKNNSLLQHDKGITDHLKAYSTARELVLGNSIAEGLSHSLLRETEFKKYGISALVREMNASSIFEKTHLFGISNALNQAASFSRLAETNLGSFDWNNIGSRVSLSATEIARTQKNFLRLTGNYSDVLKTLNTKPNWIYDAPEVAKMPAIDYYSSSRLLKIVTTEDEEVAEIQKSDIVIHDENKDAIIRLLPKLEPNLIDMWNGATYALNSDNPDKIRHFITSLRELFGHVMRLMASDKNMASWDAAREHYDEKGRPTRKGRFLYICRNVEGSKKELAKLMMSEIDSTLQLIDLFQAGTHAIKSKFSPEELKFIQIKSETTLRFFLNVEFGINRA